MTGGAKRKNHDGFTLIELSLSIAFIAILSIAIVLIIMNSVSSYRRGTTLNQLNTVGMDLVDDIRTTIQGSPVRAAVNECSVFSDSKEVEKCTEDEAFRFIYLEGGIRLNGENENVPGYGAFCTGNYSFIWNSGYFFNQDDNIVGAGQEMVQFRYKIGENNEIRTATNFKLLKVRDMSRRVCISAATEGDVYRTDLNYNGFNGFDISEYAALEDEPTDILTGDSLAIYDFSVDMPAVSATYGSMFYPASFILGTVLGGINIMATGNYCDTPSGIDSGGSVFNYCAINKFNFAARAAGG